VCSENGKPGKRATKRSLLNPSFRVKKSLHKGGGGINVPPAKRGKAYQPFLLVGGGFPLVIFTREGSEHEGKGSRGSGEALASTTEKGRAAKKGKKIWG